MLTAIPAPIPSAYIITAPSPGGGSADTGQYDILVGGLPFNLATSSDNPFVRRKVQATAQRIQQASEPGEATLTDWWRAAQSSFHAGAGQKYLEPTVPNEFAKSRYDTSFNVDPFTPGQLTRLPDVSALYTAASTARGWLVSGFSGADEYAIYAGAAEITSLKMTGAGMVATPSTVGLPGGTSALTVSSLCSDGVSYFVGCRWTEGGVGKMGVWRGTVASAATPVIIYSAAYTADVYVGWAKGRLMAAVARSVYELNGQIAAGSNSLPASANFTHVATSWTGSGGFAESPTGVLVAGTAGVKSDIVELTLTDVAGVPTLVGGSVATTLPDGEYVTALQSYSGSFLGIGTTRGLRVGTWAEYSSALKFGPVTVDTGKPVYGLGARDRFLYGSGTNIQADGNSGLFCVDLSVVVDQAGRMAWAPHLPAPALTPADAHAVVVLPLSRRLAFLISGRVFLEGTGPGSVGDAWLKTSRVRMGTIEPKLFKLGRVRGTVSSAEIRVTAYTPNSNGEDVTPLVTFANLSTEPDEFRLPEGAREWIALRFDLTGSQCVFNSYVISGLPAPRWQWEYEFSCILSDTEQGRQGGTVYPPDPRTRLSAVQELVSAGEEVQFVEWDPDGSVLTRVTVADCQFIQSSPPQRRDSFGGRLTFLLRTTEGP